VTAVASLSELGQAAVSYAEEGLRVVPLIRRDKRPVFKTGTGHELASNDPAVVAAWWRQYPDANIGMVPAHNDLVVVDCDSGEGRQQLAALGGCAEPTIEVRSGRDDPDAGHLWFRHQGGLPSVWLGPKLEVKSRGMLVVLPPSVHHTGRQYRFLEDNPSHARPIPAALLNSILATQNHNGNGMGQTACEVVTREVWGESERHHNIVQAAARYAAKGLPRDEVFAVVEGLTLRNCDPPFPRDRWGEIAAAVDSAIAKGFARAAPDGEPLPRPKLLRDVDPNVCVEWLIEEFWLRNEPGILAGEDGLFKSTIACAIGAALAGGYRLFGRFQAIQVPVLYISEEDPEDVVRNRVEALCRGHGWNVDTVFERFHILALAGVNLKDPGWVTHLADCGKLIQPGLGIFDPLAQIDAGAENDNDERKRIVATLNLLSRAAKCHFLTVAHFKKAAEGVSKSDLIRGGNALAKASRQTYTVAEGPDGSVILENIKFSRAKKRERFVVRPLIETDANNQAVWTSARLDWVSVAVAKLDDAEGFVLEQLSAGERLTTTDLKNAAKGTGVSGADVSRALKVLEMRKLIDFLPGSNNAKLWGPIAGQAGQAEKEVAGQPTRLPGKPEMHGLGCPPPFRGATGNRPAELFGQSNGSQEVA